MNTTKCEDLADELAGAADGSVRLARGERRHVERCLRCQADLVQHRKLLRGLRSMRAEVLEPAPGLLSDILAGLEGAPALQRHAVRSFLSGRRLAYLGGLAAATTAGAVSAIVLTTSRRRTRLAS
jgi:hypothetical protein